MIDSDGIRARFDALSPHLDERERRLLAATEAKAAGFGGIAEVSRLTGVVASTIGRGLRDSRRGRGSRRDAGAGPGAGRKPLVASDPDVLADLMALVEPGARGDPMSPLRWTCKSLRRLAGELRRLGRKISHTVVGELLKAQGFSLQANSKTREGRAIPIATRSFASSTRRSRRPWPRVSR